MSNFYSICVALCSVAAVSCPRPAFAQSIADAPKSASGNCAGAECPAGLGRLMFDHPAVCGAKSEDDGAVAAQSTATVCDIDLPHLLQAAGANSNRSPSVRTDDDPASAPIGLMRSGAVRQSLGDAWWTGPLLTASAATLPRGHVLIEPYFYDVISRHSQHFGSRSYILYGLTDKVTVGLIPVFGHNRVRGGRSSSGLGLGDTTLMAQYRLTQFRPESWVPTISAVVQETLPTGRYDRLGDRPANGLGSGTYTTTLALYSQTYFWLPNGRIMRARFNVGWSFASRAKLEGVSVYGTGAGFRGRARPGATFDVSASLEYSLTRNWVLALDVAHSRGQAGRVSGKDYGDPEDPRSVKYESPPNRSFVFAPAIEYSWTANLGLIFGTRIIPAASGRTATITPAIAVNMVF